MNTTGKRVKFWTRISRGKSEEWLLVEHWDESRVPLAAWKTLNKAFWNWRQNGWLYPLDALEAYQVAAAEMIRVAEKPPHLRSASLATYLVSAAYKSLRKFAVRQVGPTRETYRAMCRGARVADETEATAAGGEDADDRTWSDPTRTSLDVQAFVESAAGASPAVAAIHARHAASCVWTTLGRLEDDARAGLEAWLEADGIWCDAAKLYDCRGSVQGYIYRFHHVWAPAFRQACEWQW